MMRTVGVPKVSHFGGLRRLMKPFVGIMCIALAILLNGCSSTSKTTPQPTNSMVESKTPCPLVTDADLARLNPVLKRAGDEWEEHNGSIYCYVDFGWDVGSSALRITSKTVPKPFEVLGVDVIRSADLPANRRYPRDLCTHPGYAHIGECHPQKGVGDYAFYTKTLGFPKIYKFNGMRYGAIPKEVVMAISGPYQIEVEAEYWKGGSPKQGAIELAKKLAAQYH
jgi:hypothetical protein